MKAKSKKLNNKGFSLVELIIVMAIMAILVGAVAPQVFKYVERAREAKDLQLVNTAFTAVQTAVLSSEVAVEKVTNQSIDDALETISTSTPDVSAEIKSLLGADMETESLINGKCVSKNGKAGLLKIDYNNATGKLQVYIALDASTLVSDATIGPVIN